MNKWLLRSQKRCTDVLPDNLALAQSENELQRMILRGVAQGARVSDIARSLKLSRTHACQNETLQADNSQSGSSMPPSTGWFISILLNALRDNSWWISLGFSTAALMLVIWFTALTNDGIFKGWPDVLKCEGAINAGDDRQGLHVFYLVHANHAPAGSSDFKFYYRLAPGSDGKVTGNAPQLRFHSNGTWDDKDNHSGEHNCLNRSIDQLKEKHCIW